MANKINFITGETYTFAELFSGERRIIIPDLQRDYCWGNEDNIKSTGENGELVSGFVNNLLTQFDEYQNKNDKDCLNLGLFYGYEVPANHIQLCDGQQRLTTLYLLLGMINKKTIEHKDETQLTEGKFRRYLISDFEYKHDDKEPYLNYAIRESSLYFLSDLVCNFFIGNEADVENIKSEDWYFDYYNLDPSIQSMLKALSKIESILKDKGLNYYVEFGEWLLNKVTFLYFDMENRKNGEETFVVINTTGESLSSTQNLKPLVLQEKNATFDNTCFINDEIGIDKCWEEIETWFWRQRKGDNDTADAGFAEFLRWISIIEQVDKDAPEEEKTDSIKKHIQLVLQGKHCDFPYKEIPFEKIYKYWEALVWLEDKSNLSFENYLSPSVNKDVNNRNAIGQADCFVWLPVLKFVYLNITKIDTDTTIQRNARRIYEFFKNLIRIDNVSKAVNTLVGDTIKVIDLLKDGDLVSLIDTSVGTSAISKQILTDEEKKKLEILKNSKEREPVEVAFWKAQEHYIWSGEILPMIEWATDENGNFDLGKFNNYREKFAEVFAGECNANIDNTRRALLTRELKDFPRVFRGYTNKCFGWEWSDWQVLINDNKDEFKCFFDDLLKSDTLQNMIDVYATTTDKFYRFVKNPELLAYCEQKNIQKWDSSYCLVKQRQAKKYLELETFCLYLDYKSSIVPYSYTIALSKNDGIDYKGWKMWLWEYRSTALVFDKVWNGFQVAIDVHYNRTKVDDWDVQLFLRPGKGCTETDLKDIASSKGLNWNGERYELRDLSKSNVIDKTNALLSSF
ncbi:MAG: DUF262 domain-containing protein [Bacteroidales bacterium]|nr:DUF262 domain-containing protein [Bacteroidales bacterium]